MKKHFEILVKLLCASMCLAVAACSTSEETDGPSVPNFPTEQLTPTIQAGESYTIPISPNMDWSVSIDRQKAGVWFWLDDNGITTFEIRGKAGKFNIVVCVSKQVEYDNERSIDVTLTMGGESMVIATVTRGILNRSFDLYACDMDENQEFIPSANPEESSTTYQYTNPVNPETDRIELFWPETMLGYRRPIKIQANFDWRLASKPEWVSNLNPSSGKAGATVEIQLIGDPTKYPLQDTEEKIVFCDASNTEQTYSYPIYIDGCEDRFTYSVDKGSEFLFNAKGEYAQNASGTIAWNSQGVSVSVTGIEGYKLFALNRSNELYASAADWVEIIPEEDGESSLNVLKSTDYAITTTINTSEEARSAGIVMLPAQLAESVHSADELISGGNLKPEYEKYLIILLNQDASTGYISVQDVANLSKCGALFEKIANDHWSIKQFGDDAAPNNYKLTYNRTDSWEEIGLVFTGDYKAPTRQIGLNPNDKIEYMEYEVYGINGPSEQLDPSNCWLTLHANTMDNILKNFKIEMNPTKYANDQKEGFIMIKDADQNRVAMIYCVYDPTVEIGGDEEVNVKFAYPDYAESIDNSTLELLTSGAIYDQYAHYGVPVYHLTYVKENASISMLTGLNGFVPFISETDLKWIHYEGGGENQTLTMNAKLDDITLQPGESRQGEILFYKDATLSEIALVLVCTLSL